MLTFLIDGVIFQEDFQENNIFFSNPMVSWTPWCKNFVKNGVQSNRAAGRVQMSNTGPFHQYQYNTAA